MIAHKELPCFNPMSIYTCQDATWMNKLAMQKWVDKVLGAYLAANPLLVSRIVELGVKVIHITGGCTGLCQPLDVGVNQSFKARCRWMWEEWLVDFLNETNEVRDGTHEEVSERTAAVFWEMVGSRVLRNAWRKMGYDWFPGLIDPEDAAVANTGGNDDGGNGNDGKDDGKDDEKSYAYNESLFGSNEEGEESDDDDSEDKGDD